MRTLRQHPFLKVKSHIFCYKFCQFFLFLLRIISFEKIIQNLHLTLHYLMKKRHQFFLQQLKKLIQFFDRKPFFIMIQHHIVKPLSFLGLIAGKLFLILNNFFKRRRKCLKILVLSGLCPYPCRFGYQLLIVSILLWRDTCQLFSFLLCLPKNRHFCF